MVKIVVYTSIVEGGVGLVGIADPNTLLAAIQSSDTTPGSGSFFTVIRAIRSGEASLYGYIRSATSGHYDLSATLSGFVPANLYAVIRPTYTGSGDLLSFIEPIPGVDLSGNYIGVVTEDLGSLIDPIPGESLSGTISGVPFSDLLATLYGFQFEDLSATYSGFISRDLSATLTGTVSGMADLNATVHGFLGINIPDSISGYIRSAASGQQSLSGTILGLSFGDITGHILGSPSGVDLPSTISGMLFDNPLIGTITGTGDISNLYSYIRSSIPNNNTVQAAIDGFLSDDLIAIYNNDTASNTLQAIISPTGTVGFLNAQIFPNIATTISATYDVITGNLLQADINPIGPEDIYATISPKVFYIDSTIPINTYDFDNLKIVINADICETDSAFSNLAVIISGTPYGDIQGSIIGVQGQYAVSTDELLIYTKNSVQTEDWIFIITQSPIVSESDIPIILTTSPLKDLYATIVGVQQNSDLTSSISPIYISPVIRDGIPIGQWVNIKTGETKLVRLLFTGDINNFYYSSLANKTYTENANDTLKIIVETYKKVGDDTSLLSQKTEVRQCIVDKLEDFPSIDEAIKYAIKCSVNEISENLRAEIIGVGGSPTIASTISGIDSKFIKDLISSVTAVTNDPVVSGSILGVGDISSLYSYINSSLHTGMTFLGTDGYYYFPELILTDSNEYSIVLTKVTGSGTLNTVIPDLSASIHPIETEELDATVSGI